MPGRWGKGGKIGPQRSAAGAGIGANPAWLLFGEVGGVSKISWLAEIVLTVEAALATAVTGGPFQEAGTRLLPQPGLVCTALGVAPSPCDGVWLGPVFAPWHRDVRLSRSKARMLAHVTRDTRCPTLQSTYPAITKPTKMTMAMLRGPVTVSAYLVSQCVELPWT